MTAPQAGDRVFYQLDTEDAARYTTYRDNFARTQATSGRKHPHPRGHGGGSGYQAHIGLPVHPGMWLPADIVLTGEGDRVMCLQIILPGPDHGYALDVPYGDGPGCWKEYPQ